jgi:DNA-binding CsgD family transcriptional regulator
MSSERWARFSVALDEFPGPVPTSLALSAAVFADPFRSSAEALEQLDEAIGELRDADPVQVIGVARAGVFVDRVPDCRGALIRVVKEGRAGDGSALAVPALSMLATSSNLTGRWEESEQFAQQSLELAQQLGFGLSGWFPRQNKMMLASFRGDEETTQQLVQEMMQWAIPRRVRSAPMFWNLALHFVALGSGDFEVAYQHAVAITPPGVLAQHASSAVYALLGFVEAAVRTGRDAEAASHVDAMRAEGISAISSRLALEVAACEALVAPVARRTELFERALGVPEADRWPFQLARVHLAFGEHLRRDRAISEARVQLHAALTTFESLGARTFAARAATELRAAGIGRTPAQGGRGEALTAQELEVATLAASGLTNKQIAEKLFMSPRTVGAHLYRIFPKLGISSRAALRDALSKLGHEPTR